MPIKTSRAQQTDEAACEERNGGVCRVNLRSRYVWGVACAELIRAAHSAQSRDPKRAKPLWDICDWVASRRAITGKMAGDICRQTITRCAICGGRGLYVVASEGRCGAHRRVVTAGMMLRRALCEEKSRSFSETGKELRRLDKQAAWRRHFKLSA